MDNVDINRLALKRSLLVHGVLLVLLMANVVWNHFFKPTPPEPMPFTIVLPDPVAMEDERREKQDVKIDETVPLQTKDSVTIQRRKKEKKKNNKKTERKKKEKKPFVRGRRINKPDEPKIDFTKFKRVTQMTSHEKALSQKQIEQALKNGARIGTRNRIPESEQGRCVGLVQNALYNAWTEMPSYNDVGDRTVHLQIRLSRTGRIVSYRIVKSSGIASYDSSVLKAAAGCSMIRGLTSEFLKQFETLTVEFKVER